MLALTDGLMSSRLTGFKTLAIYPICSARPGCSTQTFAPTRSWTFMASPSRFLKTLRLSHLALIRGQGFLSGLLLSSLPQLVVDPIPLHPCRHHREFRLHLRRYLILQLLLFPPLRYASRVPLLLCIRHRSTASGGQADLHEQFVKSNPSNHSGSSL